MGGRKEKWGEGEIISPKLEYWFFFFFFFLPADTNFIVSRVPGSNLIEIGVGRGSFQKFMFILGDFSGFIYRSGSQPVL